MKPCFSFPDNIFDQRFTDLADMSPFEHQEEYNIRVDPYVMLIRIDNDAGYNFAYIISTFTLPRRYANTTDCVYHVLGTFSIDFVIIQQMHNQTKINVEKCNMIYD